VQRRRQPLEEGGPRALRSQGPASLGRPRSGGGDPSAEAVTQRLLDQSAKKLIAEADRRSHRANQLRGARFAHSRRKRGSLDWNVPATHVNVQRPRKRQVSREGRHAGYRRVCPCCQPASQPLPLRGPTQGAQLSNGAFRFLCATAPTLCMLDSVNAWTAQQSHDVATPVHRAVPLSARGRRAWGGPSGTLCRATTAVTVHSSLMLRPTPVLRRSTSPASARAVAHSRNRLPDDGLLVLETDCEASPLCSYWPVP
jgi:hypothetical protein